MKEIARFYGPEEARVAAAFLRSQGFDVMLPEEHHLGAAPHLSFGLGGYRILAADRDAFLAKAALDEKRAVPKHEACARCGGQAVRRARHRWFPVLILLAFRDLFPFAPAKRETVCATCGHVREDKDDDPQRDL